jgi:hypothetical protein
VAANNDSLAQGLVGYWTFDGKDMAGAMGITSARTTYDRSGNGNNGKYWNATNTPAVNDKLGQALGFDGSDDYVTLPPATTNPVSGGTAVTISAWFKGTLIQSAVRLHGNDLTYILLVWGTSAPICAISTDGGVSDGVNINGVQDNRWHHVAMTWQKNTTNGFKVYVDGAVSAQKTSGNVDLPIITGGQQSTLGRYNGANPAEYTKGTLDDVRIYNRALSADEIKRLYNMRR